MTGRNDEEDSLEDALAASEDEHDFARETLGPEATEDEVQTLVDERAARDAREIKSDLDLDADLDHLDDNLGS